MNENSVESMIQKLEKHGFNQDLEINSDKFNELRKNMHKTDLSLDSYRSTNETSFRDERARKSLHLKDCSSLEDRSEDYIAELERFNPESHPIFHLIIDFPIWLWKNKLFDNEA